jgi:hypothetical protein
VRYEVLLLAERMLYTPYIWGGDDPMAGFDCSGMMIELLKSVGKLPSVGDWSAADLAMKFSPSEPRPACLMFWQRGAKIGHVEMVWRTSPRLLTIGASGGGSKTLTLEDAIRDNAYIKVRPAVPGWVKCVDPFYGD